MRPNHREKKKRTNTRPAPVQFHIRLPRRLRLLLPHFPATYTLVPVYSGGNTKYDIEPSSLDFTLGHDALTIEKVFEIKGFSASGTVLTSAQGSGVPSADVFINGTLTTKTDKTRPLSTGKNRDRMVPEWKWRRTTMTSHSLRQNHPRGLDHRSGHCTEHERVRGDSDAETGDTSPDIRGGQHENGEPRDTVIRDNKFCVLLEAGEYKASIFDAPPDKQPRLLFSPAEKLIKLTDFSVTDLLFTQILGSIAGVVKFGGAGAGA